jgi:beta-phosphoglucomutase-like phosphatase (HAD superfamily)
VSPRRAVLFDWRGTLAQCPPPGWWAERAFESIGRPATAGPLTGAAAALGEAGDDLPDIDSSAELHREATLRVVARHGIDADLAEALLALELGIQKPDPRMFTLALDALEVRPEAALIVGDRASHDGGAAAAGIATPILPSPPERLEPRRREVVTGRLG